MREEISNKIFIYAIVISIIMSILTILYVIYELGIDMIESSNQSTVSQVDDMQ